MKRVFGLVLAVFLTVSIILLAYEKDIITEVSIITFTNSYSRLITSTKEAVSIPVYLSSEDSFLVEPDSIDNTSLISEEFTLETKINEIRNSGQSEELEGITYYLYYYDITFPNLNETNYFLESDDVNLIITYQNGDSITLEIGDLHLRFDEIVETGYLELYRLYSLASPDEALIMKGIVVGLRNKSINEIEIISMDIGYDQCRLDLGNANYLEGVPSSYSDILAAFGESEFIDNPTAFSLNHDQLIWIPLSYLSDGIGINRFPMVINYSYQGQTYEYLVDDFQFFSSNHSLEGNYGKLREFIYHYQ